MRYFRIFLAGVILIAGLSGCSRYSLSAPEGFAEMKGRGLNRYLAVTPEGMKLSIRLEKNYPRKDLSFWQEALRKQLTEEGYSPISGPNPLENGKRKGVYFEWGLPFRGENYTYFTGFFVLGKKILLVEAGGEYTVYREYKENLLNGLKEMKIR